MVIAVWCDDSGFSLDTAGEGFSNGSFDMCL